jgi:hypothetical protein
MMNENIRTMIMILKQRQYVMIAVVTSLGLGLLYYFMTLSLLQTHLQAESMISPIYITISIGLSVIIALLGGVNISLVIYKIKGPKLINFKKSGSTTVFGSAFAAFTPGCPACTTPLAVILGTVGGLSIFPLQGLELKLVSVIALLFSIFWITRSMKRPSCCSTKEH